MKKDVLYKALLVIAIVIFAFVATHDYQRQNKEWNQRIKKETYQFGRAAHLAGVNDYSNPYSDTLAPRQRQEWLRGWISASDK